MMSEGITFPRLYKRACLAIRAHLKYPLIPGQTVEYNVLHALEDGWDDVWSIRKHLLLRGVDYLLSQRQISAALQRLRKAGLAAHKNDRERDRWKLVHSSD